MWKILKIYFIGQVFTITKGFAIEKLKKLKKAQKNPNFFNINNWKLHPQTDVVYVCKLSKGRKDHSPNEVIIIY